VLGDPHLAHPAATELAADLEVTNGLADHPYQHNASGRAFGREPTSNGRDYTYMRAISGRVLATREIAGTYQALTIASALRVVPAA
jgi:hypothetical protein